MSGAGVANSSAAGALAIGPNDSSNSAWSPAERAVRGMRIGSPERFFKMT